MTTEIHREMRPWLGAALVATAFALSACGGGEGPGTSASGGAGGGPTPAGASVPDTAKTIEGFFAFLRDLVTSDTSEPVVVGDFTPDTSDTEPPKDVL